MTQVGFMDVVVSCLEATGHKADYVATVRAELERIAANNPTLVERYWKAFAAHDAGEIERILLACQKLTDRFGNLRINAVTGTIHVGTSRQSSAPVFPALSRYH